MDIIDIINNIQTNDYRNNLFINNCDKYNLPIVGLEQLYPTGIPKGNTVLFYGDTESGKSLLSLSLVNNNPNLMFAYVDTHMQIHNHFDNMLLVRNNSPEYILSFFETVERGLVDVIILDDLSYIHSIDESNRITHLSSFMMNLFRLCQSKNITLILLNTISGSGEMYFNSNAIRYNAGTIVKLDNTILRDDNIIISGTIEKSKHVDRNIIFQYEAERM